MRNIRALSRTLFAFALTLCIAAPALAAPVGRIVPAPRATTNTAMVTGEEMMAPAGYPAFCRKYLAECFKPLKGNTVVQLTVEKAQELIAVQAHFNKTIVPTFDPNYVWDYPVDNRGDCNKFALAKRRALIEAGWPREALLLTAAYTETGEGHLVLVVTTSEGDYVLDNRFEKVMEWRAVPYRWVERQSAETNGRWVKIRGSMQVASAN